MLMDLSKVFLTEYKLLNSLIHLTKLRDVVQEVMVDFRHGVLVEASEAAKGIRSSQILRNGKKMKENELQKSSIISNMRWQKERKGKKAAESAT